MLCYASMLWFVSVYAVHPSLLCVAVCVHVCCECVYVCVCGLGGGGRVLLLVICFRIYILYIICIISLLNSKIS